MIDIWIFLDLRNAFDLFDRDKSGAISLAELKQVLVALNFNPTENLIRKVMKQMDTDKNGSGRLKIFYEKEENKIFF